MVDLLFAFTSIFDLFISIRQKIQVERLGFFHLCHRHNIICVEHATSFEPWLNFIAARAAQMNDVEALPQMMLRLCRK